MLKYLRFMANVEPNNRNETNSDIFPWDILKADITLFFFLSKNIQVSRGLLKPKFLSFMTTKNPNRGNETKSDIFSWNIFKSYITCYWSQKIRIFQRLF